VNFERSSAVVFELHFDTDTVQRAHPEQPLLVKPTDTLRHVLELLRESDHGSVLVQQDEKLVGIFTERDVLRLMANGSDIDVTMEEVMIRDVVTIHEDDNVKMAITKMSTGGYRRLPIVDGKQKPVGLLKVASILHYLVEHVPAAIYNLPPAPHHKPLEREGA